MAPCVNHLRRSPRGKPELVTGQIKETFMKQINNFALEEKQVQTTFIMAPRKPPRRE